MLASLDYADPGFYSRLDSLLKRDGKEAENVDAVVRDIVSKVRSGGDEVLLELTRRLDRRDMDIGDLELSCEKIRSIAAETDPELREALVAAADRIRWFHEKERLESWSCRDEDGTELGQSIMPIERVGVYVPGGTASYPSSVLMTAIPAKVACVREIIMTVPMPDGEVNPAVIAAAEIAGVDRIFSVGGAQAVAALAYGTETVPAVDKIVGPGNAYVAAAKKMVFGKVGIDMIAGPSEVVVIADSTADPEWVAMDLFAQAEHDELAQSIAIVTDPAVGEAVLAAVERLLPGMERRRIIEASLSGNGALIRVGNTSEAAEVTNYIAPEHLELMVSDPSSLAGEIRHAGAIFIGKYSAEALGDYCAGPNHVLPTSGTARFSSPLGVYDFQKRSSTLEVSPAGAGKLSRIAATMARSEGLTAHERAATYRAGAESGNPLSADDRARQSVRQWVPESIRSMCAYTVPDPAGMVKLDAMENPYTLPDSLKREWVKAVGQAEINRYPDPQCRELKRRLGELIGLPDSCGLILGNGSDELIQMLVLILGGRGRTIMAPSPSFSMYRQICLATSTRFVEVPLGVGFSLDTEAMIEAIRHNDPACIFLAYPNNPTGNAFDSQGIREILDAARGLVVIDEAYHAFSGKSFLGEIARYPNAVLLRTLSKNGLAGLRLGLAVASAEWAGQIEKVRFPYNINVLTQASASLILDNSVVLDEQAARIVEARKAQFEVLRKVDGVTVFPSETNFHLIRVSNAERVYRELLERGVLVKNLHGSDPVLEQCLRVTVGTPGENARFLHALEEILDSSGE
ncbi:MAG: histidinol dehydrogenase [Gammaproteobacteria bacterium]|nr:histidinol dehydrogenase [Gammaproteobacteria bacterium]